MTEPAATTNDPADVTTDPDNEQRQDDEEHGDTFPRSYVEKLRSESGGYRDRAKTAEALNDELSKRLHTELVRAKGVLADPTDLSFDPLHLDDDEKLTEAIDSLLTAKPHLRVRKPAGSVGQGVTGKVEQPFSLLDRLKQGV